MKTVHRISLSMTPDAHLELSALGFVVAAQGFVAIECDEADPRWPALSALARRRQLVDVPNTVFTRAELRSAHRLVVDSSWHWSYPQPEDAYLQASYDLADYCRVCGLGAVQREAFRMVREPQWGAKHFLQLNWIFDEFFCRRDVWEEKLRPLGVTSRPVVHARTGAELDSVVQIVASDTAKVHDLARLPAAIRCPTCARVKHEPAATGRFPRVSVSDAAVVAKTDVWFGSGAKAFKRVVVSRAVFQVVEAARLKGIEFTPVDD